MKVFFVLISFLINFAFYIAPTVIFQYISRKHWKRQILSLNLHQKSDLTLIAGTYAIWFTLYLLDPTQKTVRQMIFVDPVIIGTILFIMLVVRFHMSKKASPNKVTFIIIAIAWISAIFVWFGVPPSQ